MTWILWALLLVLQNASATLVSRARQSNSYYFHAAAAVGSNGIWFASQFILIDSIVSMAKTGSWPLIVATGVFYTTFTIIGSVGMHYISARHIERKLKVNEYKP
jgi:hypothetical protein